MSKVKQEGPTLSCGGWVLDKFDNELCISRKSAPQEAVWFPNYPDEIAHLIKLLEAHKCS